MKDKKNFQMKKSLIKYIVGLLLLLAVVIYVAVSGINKRAQQRQQEQQQEQNQQLEQENQENAQQAEDNAAILEQFFEDFLINAPAELAQQGEGQRDEIFQALFAPYMSAEYYDAFIQEWVLYPGIFAERGISFAFESLNFFDLADSARFELTVLGSADGQKEEFTIEGSLSITDGVITGFEMENFRSFQSFLDNF